MSNPVPSNKISDGKLNFQSLDRVVNGDATVTTRTGKQIRSLSQTQAQADSVISGISAQGDAAAAATGWFTVDGSFADGGTLTAKNQVLFDDSTGAFYSWGGALPKIVPPASTVAGTGGQGASAWSNRGDAALRSELAATDSSVLVGGVEASKISDLIKVSRVIPSVSELRARDGLYDGEVVSTLSYYELHPNRGGANYIWVDGSTDSEDGIFTIGILASGRWKLITSGKVILQSQCGVISEDDSIPDANKTDWTSELANAISVLRNTGFTLKVEKGVVITDPQVINQGNFSIAGTPDCVWRLKARVLTSSDIFGLPYIVSETPISGFSMRGFTIDGNKQNHTGDRNFTQETIWLSNCTGCDIELMRVINSPHNGIAIFNSSENRVSHCYVDGADGWGIHCSDGGQGEDFASNDNFIAFNTVKNSGDLKSRGGIDNTGTCRRNVFIGNNCSDNFKNYEWSQSSIDAGSDAIKVVANVSSGGGSSGEASRIRSPQLIENIDFFLRRFQAYNINQFTAANWTATDLTPEQVHQTTGSKHYTVTDSGGPSTFAGAPGSFGVMKGYSHTGNSYQYSYQIFSDNVGREFKRRATSATTWGAWLEAQYA